MKLQAPQGTIFPENIQLVNKYPDKAPTTVVVARISTSLASFCLRSSLTRTIVAVRLARNSVRDRFRERPRIIGHRALICRSSRINNPACRNKCRNPTVPPTQVLSVSVSPSCSPTRARLAGGRSVCCPIAGLSRVLCAHSHKRHLQRPGTTPHMLLCVCSPCAQVRTQDGRRNCNHCTQPSSSIGVPLLHLPAEETGVG